MNAQANLYDNLIHKFDAVSENMALSEDIAKILRKMNNEIVLHFPIKMDNGEVRIFTGYRVQHNNVLGPYKGGLRYHNSVSLDDMRALALLRTWKSALLGIPLGGSMGGVKINTSDYTFNELERITRRYVFNLGTNIGPEYDILEPGINANSQAMAWIYDTYLSTMPPQNRNRLTHVVSGKPLKLGGCPGSDKAAGQGLVFLIEEWLKDQSLKPNELTAVIQGFGNVGYWTARLLKAKGVKIIAIQDKSGSVFNREGIDPEDLLDYVNLYGKLTGYPKTEKILADAFFSTKADIFITAALDGQITARTASLLNVKLVVEGTDCATDDEGDEILQQKGIDVIPDLLGNTGNLIVNYFEWLQNKRSEFWDIKTVDAKLQKKMISAYRRVKDVIKELNTDWRSACFIVALTRLDKVYNERGVFP